ncbi:mucin-2-like [Sinocyclocheilus anshuiensis]|uniref:mucin-2-like n=1 Tax=Sinocyclocheilus anshuiensis TaxID=1608454 RepID=UPI0007B91DDB|nr:PREDICTED: mucin-2-like [Sinocyclocheilus anshuiensis]
MFLSCVLLLCVLHVCGGTPDPDREMCYSRQHQDAAVNTRVALDQKGTVMVARAKPSEKDCILTWCSEDIGSGLKCNLVVYEPGDLSCQLFHCPSERDCPLMTASAGVNTYNIFKGITHPTTKGRVTAKPTTTSTSTKPAPTTATSSSSSTEPTESESPVMLETVAMTTAPATTATSTTQPTSTTKSTSTKAPHPPPRTPVKPKRPKKPSKPSRPETHSVKPTRVPTGPPTSSTPSTTTATTTAALLELESGPVLSRPGKPKVSRVMWKNSLLAIVVTTLIFLALILSLAARKAMESLDRRHYTRLELNELHYEL